MDGDAPDGERLRDYVAAEVKKAPHHGETPIGVTDEAVAASHQALEAALAAAPFVKKKRGGVQAGRERHAAPSHC